MAKHESSWQNAKSLARAILYDRFQRRKILANLLFGVFGMMAAGLWILDGWLATSPGFFLLWWLGCALVTCFVMVFAVYDMLAVVREERDHVTKRDDR